MTNVSQTCSHCGQDIDPGELHGLCGHCLLDQGVAAVSHTVLSPATGNALVDASGESPGTSPTLDDLRRCFPHLEILDVLGQGGMGTVYKARQTKLDRLVALKIIHPRTAQDPAFAERFIREARTLARLNHPHIVGIHDFGEIPISQPSSTAASHPPADSADQETLYYFVMEFVDGANLRQLMRGDEVHQGTALQLIPQICAALQYAHDEGVVHRDIKPENILIDQQGRVKIADFGLAKLVSKQVAQFTLTNSHQVMGTPRYMAPEQMEGSRTVDHRADLYSLGVVFYELLTGQIPAGHFDVPSQVGPIDQRLDDIVMRALARNPDKRFQTAHEIQESVESVQRDTAPVKVCGSDRPAQQPSETPRAGLSTIVEREAQLVADWFRQAPVADSKSNRRYPLFVLLLVSLAGVLSCLLPWIQITIVDETVVAGTSESLVSQVNGRAAVVLEILGNRVTPGLIVAGSLLAAHLLFWITPAATGFGRYRSITLLLIVILALSQVLVFESAVGEISQSFEIPTGTDHEGKPLGWTTTEPSIRELEHRSSRQAGYYLAIACCIGLLAFAGAGVARPVPIGSQSHQDDRQSNREQREPSIPVPAILGCVSLGLASVVGIGIAILAAFRTPVLENVFLGLLIVAITCGLVTSCLGTWSLFRILRAPDREWGFGLAFTESVAFPFVMLDLGIVLLCFLIIRGSAPAGADEREMIPAVAVWSGLMILVTNTLAIRWLWEKLSPSQTPRMLGKTLGSPFATVRFTVPLTSALGDTLAFHFSSLGYQLVERAENEFRFQRGQLWSALWLTEIERLLTNLTVTIAEFRDDEVWISCHWRVVTMGALITKKDVHKIEEEAHELQRMLEIQSGVHQQSGKEQQPNAPKAIDFSSNSSRSAHHTKRFATPLPSGIGQWLLFIGALVGGSLVIFALNNLSDEPNKPATPPASSTEDTELQQHDQQAPSKRLGL